MAARFGPSGGYAATAAPGAPRLIEFFAGGGSVSLGTTPAGFVTVLANDYCPAKRETYAANHPHVPLDGRSIADVRGHELPMAEAAHLSGPCTDYSTNGERAGDDGEHSVMAHHGVRLINEVAALGRPFKIVIFENVMGLLSVNEGRDFAALCQAMVSAGYRVGAVHVDALRFIPQARPRLFLVCLRADLVLPPGLTTSRPSRAWHPAPLVRARAALSTEVRRKWVWWTMPVPPARNHDLADVLEETGPGMKWRTDEWVARMLERMAPGHRARIDAARAAGVWVGVVKQRLRGQGEDRARRHEVHFKGHANCLLASEGNEMQRLVLLDDAAPQGLRVRDFTPRERARLTGLPEDYVLPGATRTRELTGDAIVVPAYEWLAHHLLRPLAEAPVRAEPDGNEGLPRPVMPNRTRKARDAKGQVVSGRTGIKGRTVSVSVYLVPEAHRLLMLMAQEAGVPMQEYLLRLADKERAASGLPALPRYAPAPRRAAAPRRRGEGSRPGCRRQVAAVVRRVAARLGEAAPPHVAEQRPVCPVPAEKTPPLARRARPAGRGGARARLADSRSPFRYPGGKAQAAPVILSAMGNAPLLVEPYAGGASVSVQAVLSGLVAHAVLAERDVDIRTFWQVAVGPAGEDVETLMRAVAGARPERAYWWEFLARVEAEPVPGLVAARALLACRYHWGGVPTAGLARDEELVRHWRGATMTRRLAAIRGEAHRFSIRCDAMEAIAEHARDHNAQFFVDPPYTLGGSEPGRRLYRCHEVDHEALFRALSAVRGRVLATYPDEEAIRRLAAEHGFRIGPLAIRDAHRRDRRELLLRRGTPGRAVS